MEYLGIKKWVQTFGVVFIVISIVELINTLFLLNTQVCIEGHRTHIQNLFFSSNRLPITSYYIFMFLMVLIFCFLLLGIMLIKIVSEKNIDYKILAKYLLILGVLIIIFSYVKMGYIAYLEKAQVNIDGRSISFKYFIYKYNTSIIGPYDLLVSWTFYTATVCCYLIIGLILSGGGLNWIIELNQNQSKQ